MDSTDDAPSLDPETRATITLRLCREVVMNAAFYRAGRSDLPRELAEKSSFWQVLNGNFLDVATLNWCALFADHRGVYRWEKALPESERSLGALCEALKIHESEFRMYVKDVRRYRNKRVAHRDKCLSGPLIYYPKLDLAMESATWLSERVLDVYPAAVSPTAPSLRSEYDYCFDQASDEYRQRLRRSQIDSIQGSRNR